MELYSSPENTQRHQGAEAQGYWGKVIYTQLFSGEDVRHSESNREQEKETGENESLREKARALERQLNSECDLH